MLIVESLTKAYPARAGGTSVAALRGVSFEVRAGDFFTLLGPSGCGKTTTLQCLAGLETADTGRIAMAGEAVFSASDGIVVPANRRDLGMVFQSYAIWPHMTVAENVAFPLVHGARRTAAGEVAGRVRRALDMVKLAGMADRPAPLLSGGQQQRVALARALVHEPRLLLLDEPLSNLDARLRDQMRVELRQLVKSLGITTVFVTHDQIEAMAMSDSLALMRDGQIVQIGPPRQVYLQPSTAFAADFMGRSNLVPGRLVDGGRVETRVGPLLCASPSSISSGAEVLVIVRPQAIVIHPSNADMSDRPNCWAGRVTGVSFLGDVVEAELRAGDLDLKLLLDPYAGIDAGQEVIVELPPGRCVVVPADPALADRS